MPGPVNIHENVLRAMQVPGQNHRDPWFAEFYKKCLHDLKLIFGTKEGTTIIFPGGRPPHPAAALACCLQQLPVQPLQPSAPGRGGRVARS